ncbi:hypothetical protein J437_LFUL003466 [Ladona fulva]|uniref:DUF229 domain-containing protein n=1 Tax=Ladona fulva TaxID=123851 RepID=A0A8K0JU27_LADFU|nr:hypothetical protein J437_LFUL003466 [Ladona fulva]
MQYVRPYPPFKCGRPQSYLTYLDHQGYLHRNESGMKESGISAGDLQCSYQEIVRCNHTDDKVVHLPRVIFEYPVQINSDFVLVKCYQLPFLRLVYETAHAYIAFPESKGLNPILNDPNVTPKSDVEKRNRPSVLIIVFDSMSRLNFIRQLSKTYAFLTDKMDAVVFKGLTKTGDNTYPNILPMLSGLGAYEHLYAEDLQKGEKLWVPIWGGKKARYGSFDAVPLVWKNFTEAGYITMFAEDLPEYAIFNYLSKGFLEQPTDYYMRPFWLVMDNITHFKSSDNRCYGNIPRHTFLYNYTEEFVTKMSNYSYFAFSFLTQMSHDYLNLIKLLDHDIESMLKRFFNGPSLSNTITIVMGDHGNRFDAIRSTVIGRVEERMPFFSIVLPESLKKSHPHLQHGLKANRETLLSWFDIYELLMDIAMDNLGEVSEVKRWGVIGLSPFRPIPKNRTCRDVAVPRTYCVCGAEKEIDPKDSHAVVAAETLINHVNNMLKSHGAGDKCAELTLKKVLSAQVLLPSKPVVSPNNLVLEVRVTIETTPGGARLEGVVERSAWSDDGGRVIGDVNRINKYGNQSYCVEDLVAKLFCYCNSFVKAGP